MQRFSDSFSSSPVSAVRRIAIPESLWRGAANIRQRYHLEHASWIWPKAAPKAEVTVVGFTLDFELEASLETTWHISADERFELFLDGVRVGRGPDRSDPSHWAFSSYAVSLASGTHRLEVLVTALGEFAPVAQMSVRPGFIFSAEGLEDLLNTGRAPWLARWKDGVSRGPAWAGADYHVIGPSFRFEGSAYFVETEPLELEVRPAVVSSPHGIVTPGHRLEPSDLPEQIDQQVDFPMPVAHRRGDRKAAWGNATGVTDASAVDLGSNAGWQVAAHCEETLLVDLGNYVCGYPEFSSEGGRGSQIFVEMAESLWTGCDLETAVKGNRGEWKDKWFFGFGDEYLPDGNSRTWRSLWWRSGRYVQIHVKTGEEGVRLSCARLSETRLPVPLIAPLEVEEAAWIRAEKLWLRGLEVCAHEVFVDCPFFEQLSYVGDARLQALCHLALHHDDRLVRRTLKLFDWSRIENGLVAERYPSRPAQMSATYAIIWLLMVRDYAWWRDDVGTVRDLMPGVRSLVEEIRRYARPDGLLTQLPGWSFIDWSDDWVQGTPPGGAEGLAGSINLFWMLGLEAAADLESVFGDEELAQRNRRLWRQLRGAVELFSNSDSGEWGEAPQGDHASVHAATLATLAGLEGNLAARLRDRGAVAQTSFYFDFYVLEALYRDGAAELFEERLEPFTRFTQSGLLTPPEKSDPSRSDCHAWSSHPVFHLRASLLGVRPGSAGFRSVRIAPLHFSTGRRVGVVPHPRGEIHVTCEIRGELLYAALRIPDAVEGVFVWNGQEHLLAPGRETILELFVQQRGGPS
jgi:hypothetical protein